MPKAPSNLIFYLQIALASDHQESNNVTTALVESPPHSVSCCSSIKTKSELHFGSDDSGHHEHSSSSPASSRTSHYDTSEADHDLGELCRLGDTEVGIEDSISSGSDSGFGHKKSPSYCSRCSEEDSCEDYQKPDKKSMMRGRKSGVKKSQILRKHSRASSVDRREIFNKYIQKSSEHTDSIRPFSSDDPELCHETEKDRNQEEFLLVHEHLQTKNSDQSNQKKEFRLVRMQLDDENLGIFLARQNQVEIGCHGYFVVYILPDGLVKR